MVRRKKVCTRCGGDGPFNIAKRGKFGVTGHCVSCRSELQRNRRATPRGRALMMWNAIVARCGRDRYYKNVELRVTRAEFLQWAELRLKRWFAAQPGISPSVDRKRSAGHYELANMRIVTRGDNTRNRAHNKNLLAPRGKAWCGGRCQKYLPKSCFAPRPSRSVGVQGYCRKCLAEYRANRRELAGRYSKRRVKERDW